MFCRDIFLTNLLYFTKTIISLTLMAFGLPISLIFLDYYCTVDLKSLLQKKLKRTVITTNHQHLFVLFKLHKDLLFI